MYGWDTGTWVWMAVSMIVIAVALAVVVLVATRGAFHGEDTAGAKPATTILDERFARGEIEREEYEERRRVLTRTE